MTTEQHISIINQLYKSGNTTEHTFRGDLQQLLESLVPHIRATNKLICDVVSLTRKVENNRKKMGFV